MPVKPWKLVGQRLDTSTQQPKQLHLEITERGALCPVCGKARKAHDFADFTWRECERIGPL